MGKLVHGRAMLGVDGTTITCDGLISITSVSNGVDSTGRGNCFFIGCTGRVDLGSSCRCLLTFPGRCVVDDDSDAFRFEIGPRPTF